MRTGLIAVCLTFLFRTSDVGAVTMLGAGNLSCGSWIAQRDEMVRQLNISWVLGYLSGMNLMADKDFLKSYEVNGITEAINKYCRENPLNNITDAATDTAIQMRKMKR
jgi:hypothetical protein